MLDRLYRSVGIISVALLTSIMTGSAAPSQEEQFPAGMLSSEESRQQKRIIVNTTSGEAELALAAHLSQTGATLYGAY